LTAQEAQERDALGATRADCVVTSLRQAVEQVVNAAKDAASADLVGEIRALAGAPPAAADGDTVMEDKADRGRVTPLPRRSRRHPESAEGKTHRCPGEDAS
jgi:hypothetical protein